MCIFGLCVVNVHSFGIYVVLSSRAHPRWKRQIADRLWVGALQVAYNITSQGRFQGPFPSNFILAGNRRMEIDYDNFQVELEFRDIEEATAFEVTSNRI